MTVVDQFTLISGAPCQCGDFVVYPPTLEMIRDIGYDNYRSYVSLFLLSQRDIFAMLDIGDDAGVLKELSPIQLITVIPDLRVTLLCSLRFFLRQEIFYTKDLGFFLDEVKQQQIPLSAIMDIRRVILAFCKVEDDTIQEPITFRNERARLTYEKAQKHKAQKKQKAAPSNTDMELHNLIGAVAAFSQVYNLLNIWGLTVYQFYDQFERLSSKRQLDVIGQKWAAWGTDDFDFSLWFKSTSKST